MCKAVESGKKGVLRYHVKVKNIHIDSIAPNFTNFYRRIWDWLNSRAKLRGGHVVLLEEAMNLLSQSQLRQFIVINDIEYYKSYLPVIFPIAPWR